MAKVFALLLVACAFAAISAENQLEDTVHHNIALCAWHKFIPELPPGHPEFQISPYIDLSSNFLFKYIKNESCEQAARHFVEDFDKIPSSNLEVPMEYKNCVAEELDNSELCSGVDLEEIFTN